MLIIIINSIIWITLLVLIILVHDDDLPLKLFTGIIIASFLLVPIGVVIGINASGNHNAECLAAEYDSIQLRLDKSEQVSEKDSFVEINSLYKEVYEYNIRIKNTKRYGNSVWTNWFYSRAVVNNAKYIEIQTS